MELELVSFKLCPYVQRCKITLGHKGVDHKTTYVDLENLPDWFHAKSPLGLVPILIVRDGDKEDVLFESAVINEFLDEITPGTMLPTDPVKKAKARAWIEFAGTMNMHVYMLTRAEDEATFEEHRKTLEDKLRRLEGEFVGPYFTGDEMSLVDTGVAPLFMRLRAMEKVRPLVDLSSMPKIKEWSDRMLALPEVQNSVVEDWDELNDAYLQKFGGVILQTA